MTIKKSFLLHLDSLDVLDHLSDEQSGQLLKAFKSFHLGEEINLESMLSIAFVPFKNQFRIDDKKSRIGENHWNWQGGITEENHALRCSAEYANWRIFVFARDKYRCMECGGVDGVLNAHHIKKWSEYPELRFDVDNGLTLCEKCHKELHRGQ